MPSYRLTIEYEGTRYRGWQEQKNARTVAGELRLALERAAGASVELGGSGRTDAGVHAAAQVAHARWREAIDPGRVLAATNAALPADIHLLALAPAPPRFHARHDAVARSYLYQIARRRTAFGKRFVWWVERPLDLAAMAAAAHRLPGRHDFARFADRREEGSTLVEVERAELVEAGDLVLFRIVASHFLWRMVRRLVGTLVAIGAGELDEGTFLSLVESPELESTFEPARVTAPPSGLFLERVVYPGEAAPGALGPIVPVVTPAAGARAAGSATAPRRPFRPGRANRRGPRGRGGGPAGRGPRSRR
ncbi:MAG: tRNA pseudouridine(38-40) synthase TruA [Holophagales bacterium]|nr:tRNA pseudouridine(38-40) synthase TruA [Holophagales bacterium]